MAKLGFQYEVDTDTDKQFSGAGSVIPHMYAKIWAEAIEIRPTKDTKGFEANITFEVQEPEDQKGRKFWGNWTILHPDTFNHGAYKYGKPMFDRFARAVGVNVNADTDTDELIFKTFTIETGLNKGQAIPNKPGEFYKDQTQIAKFFYEDAAAKEPVPAVGIIGDGEFAAVTPKAANSNVAARPAANSNAAATGKKNPWDKPSQAA